MTECIGLNSRSMSTNLIDADELNQGNGNNSDSSPVVQTRLNREFFNRLWRRLWHREAVYVARVVKVGEPNAGDKFAANVIRNQKYTAWNFLFLVLYEQFKLFLNFCFLVMALSQFVPQLKIGYLYTYWGPLSFVLFVTVVREAIDDIRRWRRDREMNSTNYSRLTRSGLINLPSSAIKVGDVIRVNKNERVPADMVLLRTSDTQGTCYLRTDQLDGETDWKLRHAPLASVQALDSDEELLSMQASVAAEKPGIQIDSFNGTLTVQCSTDTPQSTASSAIDRVPLSVENTMWANTVLASGWAVGVVVYTGNETRAVMNNSLPHSKFGMVDREINDITKLLVGSAVVLSLLLIALKGFGGQWYKYYWRFLLLFSYIIPLALRMNLDMAKITYSFLIMRDPKIPDNIVRNTTIPEELGRISYLLTDKTGTLTENDMVFKKLHLGSLAFTDDEDSQLELQNYVKQSLATATAAAASSAEAAAESYAGHNNQSNQISDSVTKAGADIATKAVEAVKAIAMCHNVTPVYENGSSVPTYQASSPDEVALVKWTAAIGLSMVHRDLYEMRLCPSGDSSIELRFSILQLFPFSSESKRMGIIVKDQLTNEIIFYTKGADTVISKIIKPVDWLDEEVDNLAREGLRTLLVAKRTLSPEIYHEWARKMEFARLSIEDRLEKVAQVQAMLDNELELVCVTGVEDRLQTGVRPSLETLRNAGVRVWMLTGDKLETACCVALSSRLVEKSAGLYIFQPGSLNGGDLDREMRAMSRRVENGQSIVISGENLEAAIDQDEHKFLQQAQLAPAVIVCRCSPTQKAKVVRLLKQHTGKPCAAIGDGGNDVAMIQAADCGLGIVGKEGKQASLAADFSITRFQHVTRLLLVHGRQCYKNTAVLAQFIIHRGVAISTMQAIFSAVFYYVAISLFPGLLMIGYATVFTMFPVFSLVLDRDVSDTTAEKFPELYKELTKGREVSAKTFFIWTAISLYQGGIIMYGSLALFQGSFLHVISISFTAIVLTELIMVALTVRTWHWAMVLAEFMSLVSYLIAIFILPNYFDPAFLLTVEFVWKVTAITAVSCIPFYVLKFVRYSMSPPIARKLQAYSSNRSQTAA